MLRIGLAAVLIALPATSRQDTPAWSFTCTSVTVDSCDVSCPCLVGLQPHHGACQFVNGFMIRQGSHGSVSLDGLAWAMMGEFTGTARNPKFTYVAFYIPEKAGEAQKKALRAILDGPPFAGLGKPLGVTETDVEVVVPKNETAEHTLRIGDKGSFTITPVLGGARPGEPIKIRNPVYPFPVDEILVGRAEGSFKDHGKTLELAANSGEIGTFTLSSTPAAK